MKKKALREENVERNPFCILHFSSANAIIYFDLLQENEADTHTHRGCWFCTTIKFKNAIETTKIYYCLPHSCGATLISERTEDKAAISDSGVHRHYWRAINAMNSSTNIEEVCMRWSQLRLELLALKAMPLDNNINDDNLLLLLSYSSLSNASNHYQRTNKSTEFPIAPLIIKIIEL